MWVSSALQQMLLALLLGLSLRRVIAGAGRCELSRASFIQRKLKPCPRKASTDSDSQK
ncbi:hypothetical protein ACTWQB_03535 [Piscibacillus sp. B03]|uniref:hypothetical protein n=1 Tax=Piscibacillus sp. B03 TaxID=3457430 RepID=UPI003FCDAD6E